MRGVYICFEGQIKPNNNEEPEQYFTEKTVPPRNVGFTKGKRIKTTFILINILTIWFLDQVGINKDGSNLFYAALQLGIEIDYTKLLCRLTGGS
ncbi:MAG: hypothetical protein AAF789_08030, partial [Bacteroidota bacterium]